MSESELFILHQVIHLSSIYKSFAIMQEQIKGFESCFIMGDFNARIANLSVFDNESMSINYMENCDHAMNNHGRRLCTVCNETGVIPINGLRFYGRSFSSDFTFRQSQTWISQIDWALCSISAVNCC